MHGFIVDTDAACSGESICQLRGGTGTFFAHDFGTDLINLASRYAGTHVLLHRFQHSANDLSCRAERSQLFRRFYGHGVEFIAF